MVDIGNNSHTFFLYINCTRCDNCSRKGIGSNMMYIVQNRHLVITELHLFIGEFDCSPLGILLIYIVIDANVMCLFKSLNSASDNRKLRCSIKKNIIDKIDEEAVSTKEVEYVTPMRCHF